MASDSNGLRNQIFGKVAHLVVSERGLAKIDDPIKADSEVRPIHAIPMGDLRIYRESNPLWLQIVIQAIKWDISI